MTNRRILEFIRRDGAREYIVPFSSSSSPSVWIPLDIPQISLSLTNQYTTPTWTDDTTNSYDLTNDIPAVTPTVGTLANEVAPIFDGNDFLTSSATFGDIIGPSQFEVWAVYNINNVTSNPPQYFEKASLFTDGNDGWVSLGLSSTEVQFGYNDGSTDFVVTDTVATLGSINVVRAWVDASDILHIRVNDRTVIDAGASFASYRTFTVNLKTGTNYYGGNFIEGSYHLWVFDGNISAENVTNFYQYLANTYGVTVP